MRTGPVRTLSHLIAVLCSVWGGSRMADARPANITEADWEGLQQAIAITRIGGTPYSQVAELGAPVGNRLGTAVATWTDGDISRVVAGSYGAVYVFSKAPSEKAWHQDARLAPTDGPDDSFGRTVAMKEDMIVVGAPEHKVTGRTQGAAYVFIFDHASGTWRQTSELTLAGGGNSFGASIALQDQTLAIGAPGLSSYTGWVQVYAWSGTDWSVVSGLGPTDTTGGAFGSALALDHGRLLVGSPNDSSTADFRGSVYAYANDGGSWSFHQKLIAGLDGAAGDYFGTAVALSGDIAAVGSPRGNSGGSVYSYVFDAVSGYWILQPTLKETRVSGLFGDALALSNNRLSVASPCSEGCAGTVHYYSGNGKTWTELQSYQMPPSDELSIAWLDDFLLVGDPFPFLFLDSEFYPALGSVTLLNTKDDSAQILFGLSDNLEGFGTAVAISGDTAVVRAPSEADDFLSGYGRVDIFARDSHGVWNLQALLPSSSATDFSFGGNLCSSVAIDGDTVLVGIHDQPVGSNAKQGAVHVYTRSAGKWTEQQELHDDHGSANDDFGCSVALVGNTALIGASGLNGFAGGGYIFSRTGTSWTQQAKLSPAEAKKEDLVGRTVAFNGSTAILGSESDAAYIFQKSGASWVEKKRLVGSDTTAGDRFGVAVAAAPTHVVVGAPNKQVGANVAQGRAYDFDIASWTASIINTPTPGPYRHFGSVVSTGSNLLAIAEPGSSAVDVFRSSPTGWNTSFIVDGSDGYTFGSALAVSQDSIVIGDFGAGDGQGGRAYILQSDVIFANGFQ